MLVILVLAALWAIRDVMGFFPTDLVPPFIAVASDLSTHGRAYMERTTETLATTLVGLSLSIVVTVLFGSIIAVVPRLANFFRGIGALSQTIPIVAIAPVAFYVLGWGIKTRAFVTVLISFYPLFTAFIGQFDRLSDGVHRQMRLLGLSGWQKARYVYLPVAVIGAGDGLRVSAVLAVVGAALGEMLLSDQGLGRVIAIARVQFLVERLYGAIVCLMILGLALSVAAELLARSARWLVCTAPYSYQAGGAR